MADEPGKVGCVCGPGALFRIARSDHSQDLFRLISRTAEYGPVRSGSVGGGALRGILPIPIRLPSGNLPEVGHGNLPSGSKVFTVLLDPLQLVKSVSCHVAFTAMRAADHWDPLNYEQVAPPTVGPRYAALSSPFLPTVVANYGFPNSHG